MRPGMCTQVGLDDDHHIEWFREIFVQQLCLIDTDLNAILQGSVSEITLRDGMVIYSFTEFAMGTAAFVRTLIRKAEGRIPA